MPGKVRRMSPKVKWQRYRGQTTRKALQLIPVPSGSPARLADLPMFQGMESQMAMVSSRLPSPARLTAAWMSPAPLPLSLCSFPRAGSLSGHPSHEVSSAGGMLVAQAVPWSCTWLLLCYWSFPRCSQCRLCWGHMTQASPSPGTSVRPMPGGPEDPHQAK